MNTTENRETNNQSSQTESLADLPLTNEQAEEAKAGGESQGVGGSSGVGKVGTQFFHLLP